MKEKIRTWVCGRQEACRSSRWIRILAAAELLSLLLAAVCYAVGIPAFRFSVLMIGTCMIWLAGIFFCLQNLKSRMMLLAFDLAMFVFLLITPVMHVLQNSVVWDLFEPGAVFFAIMAVGISLFFLYLGGILYEILENDPIDELPVPQNSCAPKGIDPAVFRLTALCLYLFCMVFSLIQGADLLLFMRGKDYLAYYTSYTASYPGFVYTLGNIMPFALCIYLSTSPKKLPSFLCLLLYVISTMPKLLIGMRNPFAIALVFSFLYYTLRDQIGDREKWIGKIERGLILIAVPALLILFSAVVSLRSGYQLNRNILRTVLGVFSTLCCFFNLCYGHNSIPLLPDEMRWYTFGPLIDNITRSRIGQFFFHTTPFPPGNSEMRALEGHSFGDALAYAAHPQYLDGGGWGSYYILETYVDFGWLGIVIYSLLLGLFLVWFLRGIRKGWLVKAILLSSLFQLLMIPRSDATGWLSFLVGVHFWFAVVACVVGSGILQKLGISSMLSHIQEQISALFHRKKAN